jgi:hypothetical protein
MGDKDPGIATGFGINPDHGLRIEVFRCVGDQAVLTDHHNEVAWFEAKPVKVAAFGVSSSPIHRDGSSDASERIALGIVPSLRLCQGASASAQEELGLSSCAVPFEKFVELRAPVNHNHARDQRHLKNRFVRPDLQELR